MTVNYTVQSGSLDELRCDYSRASYQEVPGEELGGGGGYIDLCIIDRLLCSYSQF